MKPRNPFAVPTAAMGLIALALAPAIQASDAYLKMKRIDCQTGLGMADPPVKTLFQSKLDPSQFYYMPSNIRFAKAEGEPVDPKNPTGPKKPGAPMFTLMKYNFVYDANGETKKEDDPLVKQNSDVFQGGALKATFTFGLQDGELKTMQDALRNYLNGASAATDAARDAAMADATSKANPGDAELAKIAADLRKEAADIKKLAGTFKLGRFPLDTATFAMELVDPAKPDGKVLVGPFTAPITDDIISVLIPLSKPANDIIYGVLKAKDDSPTTDPAELKKREEVKKFADVPINVWLTMTYSGYDVPYTVKVKGTWDSVYEASDKKVEAKASYWFVSAAASYQDTVSELRTNSKIEIEVVGQVPDETDAMGKVIPGKEAAKNRVMEEIMKAVFETSTITPAAEDKLDKDAGKAPENAGSTLFGKSVGASVGFAMKKVKTRKTGSIEFNETGTRMITVTEARYGKLDFATKNVSEHIREIKESDWRLAKPTIELAMDVSTWFGSNNISIAWPGPNGTDTLTWPAAKPGTLMQWTRNFGDKVAENAIVPFTWKCAFNSNLSSLAKAGISDLGFNDQGVAAPSTDPVEKRNTAITATSIANLGKGYTSLYGGTINVVAGNSYAKNPVALASQTLIPVLPGLTTIKFKVDGTRALDTIEYGDDGSVDVTGIKLNQTVKVKVPVITGSGAATKITPTDKTATTTLALADILVQKKRHRTETGPLYLFSGEGVTSTIDYTVEAEGKTKAFKGVPVQGGDTISIDLAELFPELKKPDAAEVNNP